MKSKEGFGLLVEKVKETIKENYLLKAGDRVLVSLSGGIDSMVLFHLLYGLQEEYSLSLSIFHLNHLFRQESAKRDAQLVQKLASSLNIPCTIEVFDVPKYCREKNLNAQEGARQVRYKLLKEEAKKRGAHKVALGHQANDQGETVLIHFFRGSGLEGLSGMKARQGIYIRPLLYCFRHEIEAYCQAQGIEYREDPSNQKGIYLRNKIRLELIPFLEENYNQRLLENLLQMSEILQDENHYMEGVVKDLLAESLQEITNDILFFDIPYLLQLPKSLTRRIFREAYGLLKGDKEGLTFHLVEEILSLLGGEKGKICLHGGMVVYREYETLVFARKEEKKRTSFQVSLLVPGVVEIPGQGRKIQAREVDKGLIQKLKEVGPATLSSLYRIYIDYDEVSPPFTVRSRNVGDWFYPLGMEGRKKVKDFLIDTKIPERERDRVPIVVDGDDSIIWLAGHRMAHHIRISASTKRVLELSLL